MRGQPVNINQFEQTGTVLDVSPSEGLCTRRSTDGKGQKENCDIINEDSK